MVQPHQKYLVTWILKLGLLRLLSGTVQVASGLLQICNLGVEFFLLCKNTFPETNEKLKVVVVSGQNMGCESTKSNAPSVNPTGLCIELATCCEEFLDGSIFLLPLSPCDDCLCRLVWSVTSDSEKSQCTCSRLLM